MNLTTEQKTQILDKIGLYVNSRFFNPLADLGSWKKSWPESRGWIQASSTTADFEERIRKSLEKLHSSHIAFFHGSGQGVPAPYALNATFLKSDDDAEPVWVFLDVLEGGVAHKAGIEIGESLIAINDKALRPPDMPRFDLGSSNELTIKSRSGQARTVPLVLPAPTDKGRPPMSELKTVHARKLSDRLGYVRVAYFPGAAGDKFALSYDRAVSELGEIDGLIIDLRGNVGGGLGSLRVMSSLCADKRPIGYNVTRKVADQGYRKDKLVRIDQIPSTKLAQLKMLIRFKILHRDRSIALFTEGLGQRKFHGRVAMLINEHTKSAAEMIADFAATNQLATLVGTRTAGEVLGAVNFVVGEGYRLRIPIGGWMTWNDRLLEGTGVSPNIEAAPSVATLRAGQDITLQRAIDLLESDKRVTA
jgi:carboxyl-terminal processing protease